MNVEDQRANAMPVDGQHHNDPPQGDKVLPQELEYVTDQMLRSDFVTDDVVQEQHITKVKELQPARVRRVAQEYTAEIRSTLPENQMQTEMEEKDIPAMSSKRPSIIDDAKEDASWSKVTGKKKKKQFKTGEAAEAAHPHFFALPDSFFIHDRVCGDADVVPPSSGYEGGLMIVDGEHRLSKKKLIKYLSDLKLKPIPDVAYDKQIKSLAKGGLMMTIPPHQAQKWVDVVTKWPIGFEIRCHPPASANRRIANSVIIFGVDENASLEEIRDGLRPVPCFVERFKRGQEPMNIVRVEYVNERIAQHVIDIGWVKFNDQVWLSAEAPRSRRNTRYCRTCKRCKLDCSRKNCSSLRCGRCGLKHKTSECKKPDAELTCLECKSSDHLMFKCPVMTKRMQDEAARKKASKKAKRLRQRQRRKERDQAAKKVIAEKESQKQLQQPAASVNSDKSFAQAVKQTTQAVTVSTAAPQVFQEVKVDNQAVNQFGFSADDMLRFACESYVAMLFPFLNPLMAEKTAKDMIGRMKAAMANGNIVSSAPVPPAPEVEMNIDHVAQTDTDPNPEPAVELEVVNAPPSPVRANDRDQEEIKQPSKSTKYKQLKLVASSTDKLATMDVDRTKDITTWSDKQILAAGLYKLSEFEDKGVRINNEWTVICGCGNMYEPRGRGEHMKKCSKSKYALVATMPKNKVRL